MDHLQAIKVFCQVVESGSFTKSALLLDLPKSTVTKLIQQLESHLKVKLLHRTTRRLTVTTEGQHYYQQVRKLLSELDNLESQISGEQAIPRGRLRVDVASGVANDILLPLLPDFFQRYPQIELDLGVADSNVDLLSENVDCVLRGGALSDLSLIARKIADLPVLTCATPAYLATYGEPQHPDQLQNDHQLVLYRAGKANKVHPLRFTCSSHSLEIQTDSRLILNESTAHRNAILLGLGIGQVPEFMIQQQLAQGLLKPILTKWHANPIPLYLVYMPNRHLSGRFHAFANWLQQAFAPYRGY